MFLTRTLVVILLCLFGMSSMSYSAPQKFSFENAEITDIIKAYAAWTGQKFVVDQNVRGKSSIVNSTEITPEEAFALLSTSLAINGYAITSTGDTMRIDLARNAAKWGTEAVSELPPSRPERMVTYVLTLRYAPSRNIVSTFRSLHSRDGMMFETSKSQIMMTDWVSNLHQIKKAIEMVDRPNMKFENQGSQSTTKTSKPTETKTETKTE